MDNLWIPKIQTIFIEDSCFDYCRCDLCCNNATSVFSIDSYFTDDGQGFIERIFVINLNWFLLESIIIVLVTTCAGAIVINLSRNIIISSVIGVIYGFLSAFFIGSEKGYVVPGGFAYRISMYFADKSTYYELAKQATIGGVLSAIIVLLILFIIGVLLFSKRRKIES